ncbi:MAG: alpha/beta hydrolase, partial [Actinobacteria bacterium]|nr:alpha/beta hydrolase [Actinomycetota bacterium]
MEFMTGAGTALAEAAWPEHGRPRFLLVLTHGAGGGPGTADLRAVAAAGRRLGGVSVLVTQPYRVAGRRAPGPADKQDAAWIEAIAALRAEIGGHPAPASGHPAPASGHPARASGEAA